MNVAVASRSGHGQRRARVDEGARDSPRPLANTIYFAEMGHSDAAPLLGLRWWLTSGALGVRGGGCGRRGLRWDLVAGYWNGGVAIGT